MKPEETNPFDAAQVWLERGRKVALGTVINTWGSAPRRPGSTIAVRDDGAFEGSVSGGCVEAAVIEAAHAAMLDGKHRRLEFGVQDQQAWSVGLVCGGHIEILVEPIAGEKAKDCLLRLNQARRLDRAIVRAVDLATGEALLIDPGRDAGALGEAAAAAVSHDRSASVEADGKAWFLTVFNPAIDLAIVGAVHIAQPLVRMAALLGFRARVIDPRGSFATNERFPGVTLSHDYPDDAFARAPLHRRSAVVALSHDPKIDDPALTAALASPAFYIGALGSRKTQAARIERLKSRGFGEEQLTRIHGPVGLAIGATSPEEIALSIIAEIVQVTRTAG